MGQIQLNNNNTSPRVPYEEDGDNGFVLCDKYIPEELIAEIFYFVDHKSLLNCQLVCKRWNDLLEEYVWRKKAEIIVGQSIQLPNVLPWDVYYRICEKKPIGRNLLKNHSGQNAMACWDINSQGGDHWKVERPPVGVPALPNDPVFEGKNCCFVTSYYKCSKRQIVDLVKEGLSPFLLNILQPSILVGEWYSGRWDCPSVYECSVSLIGENNKVLDTYQFRESISGDEKQNAWHHFGHEFECYGPGLQKIIFEHSGCDSLFWSGHYGSKMAGGSVIVKFKSNKRDGNLMKRRKSSVDVSSTISEVQRNDNQDVS